MKDKLTGSTGKTKRKTVSENGKKRKIKEERMDNAIGRGKAKKIRRKEMKDKLGGRTEKTKRKTMSDNGKTKSKQSRG